mmetsp:Transcript_24135/g.29270  ORF Transcript_24135/g.29270 Transcript_24135/m.29270 type:complete len:100 (+) Transcript_24135:95-394(+)
MRDESVALQDLLEKIRLIIRLIVLAAANIASIFFSCEMNDVEDQEMIHAALLVNSCPWLCFRFFIMFHPYQVTTGESTKPPRTSWCSYDMYEKMCEIGI